MTLQRRRLARIPAGQNPALQLGEPGVISEAGADFGRLTIGDGAALRGKPHAFKSEVFFGPAGATPKAITQVIADYSHSVKAWEVPGGPTIGTGNDDTARLAVAAANSRALFFPPGQYNHTGTIQTQSDCKIEGPGFQQVRLSRIGVWNGPSLKIGNGAQGSAGRFDISGLLIEQVHPGFTPGVNTTIVDRLTSGQALIEIFGGVGGIVHDVWLQYGVYGIRMWGGTRCNFQRIQHIGIYDSLTAGRVETVASISMPYSPTHAYGTEHTIKDCYLGGGNSTPVKTITVGSTTFSSHEDAGPLYCIEVESAEGLKILNNYLGGTNGSVVRLGAKNILSEVNIDGNFIDGSTGPAFVLASDNDSNVPFDITIANNRANGQMLSREFLRTYPRSGSAGVYELNIHNNRIKNYLMAPVNLDGVRGGTVSNNRFLAYHARSGGLGNPQFAAGLTLSGYSELIRATDNWFGGAPNDAGGTGYCQWGIKDNANCLSFASGNDGNLIAGGKLVDSPRRQMFQPGQGLWTSPVVMANSNFLWVNGTSGKLYKKVGSEPTSDTDGTIVGTES